MCNKIESCILKWLINLLCWCRGATAGYNNRSNLEDIDTPAISGAIWLLWEMSVAAVTHREEPIHQRHLASQTRSIWIQTITSQTVLKIKPPASYLSAGCFLLNMIAKFFTFTTSESRFFASSMGNIIELFGKTLRDGLGNECSKDLTWCSFSLTSCWRDRVAACFMENSAATAIILWLVSVMLVRTSFNWQNNTHTYTQTRGLRHAKYINFIFKYEEKY